MLVYLFSRIDSLVLWKCLEVGGICQESFKIIFPVHWVCNNVYLRISRWCLGIPIMGFFLYHYQ